MKPTRRLLVLFSFLALILVIGTIGFVVIEDNWSFLDSFYFTLITLTTIGYGETHTLSNTGRLFTIFLILFGVGTTAYIISTTAQMIIDGQLQEHFRSKKMNKKISDLLNHYIICGFGRIGTYISNELYKQKLPFVVIENDEDRISEIESNDYLLVKGDAANDDVLVHAGIHKAKALVIVVGSDAASVFITLSARGLSETVYILARFEQSGTEQKLFKAGANRILSPHLIGGWRMVQLLLQPNVTDFLDLATSREMLELAFEEIKIGENCVLVNQTLKESGLRRNYGIIVIGVKDSKGKMIFNPSFDTELRANDILIVIGHLDQINRLHQLKGVVKV